jgi:hypothetical protein
MSVLMEFIPVLGGYLILLTIFYESIYFETFKELVAIMKEPAMNLRFMERYLMVFIFLRTMVNIAETFRPVVMKLKSHALRTSGWVLCHF